MTREVDSSGHYVLTKHVTVSLDESGITNTRIEFFNHQNILSGETVNTKPSLALRARSSAKR
jgi:hypothetical protein